MTATTDTSEKGLESLIEASLINEAGYVRGSPDDYDKDYCVDRAQLFRFLQTTQPYLVAQLGLGKSESADAKFLKRLYEQIKTHGIVEVLRKGIKVIPVELKLYYPRPASSNNPQAAEKYAQNIFSVTRQVHYSQDKGRLSLDLVIFINGLPVATFELKNNLTKQNVRDAMRQYQTDRDPKEPLFGFARCLAHFAVDDEQVHLTTHLRGEPTDFLPFNKGCNYGAGNPINPAGLKTDYLWKHILTKPSLSTIVEKYAQIVEKLDENGKKRKQLDFPRYHQLDLVQTLLADARLSGAGKRYLIQHSAGSGKSDSIAWLAHQLVELTDLSETRPVFDSVIVVTDRRVLDRQIRNTVKQFAHVKGVVEAITEGSRQLREALEDKKKIIITTVQKFPYIVSEIQALGDMRFAILIDEAHSSQSGQAAAKMNVALSKEETDEAEETIEDKINRIIEEQHLLPNASYFAFTATPKNKTLEIFGVKEEGKKPRPFHEYTMKQAIEEEFILDVLANYTTYASYYNLLKTVEDDPQFDSKRARKKLKRFVEGHEDAIRRKAEIMVDHFLDDVIKKKKINGQAKAMVVTNSIISAIRYKLAFDDYLAEIKSPYKAIVAFSIEKEDKGKKYDEAKMNGFPSAEIPVEFKKSEYRFLIVAEKFQTGFDEPLLHTMYVDKVLSDVQAVQTLSRLNRCYKPWKTDTFVLDFVNSADAIQKAFEPYYRTTILSAETDVNRLNDLQDALDAFQVYSREQVEDLMARFVSGAPRDQLDPILDSCKQVYKDDLDADQQIDFKAKAKAFVRMYQFLLLILPFQNTYWESLKTFLRLLLPKLPAPDDQDLSKGVLESVDMDSYRVEREETLAIKLQGGEELAPVPANLRASRGVAEMDYLSNIVREFNERFGTDWTADDKRRRFLFEDLPTEVAKDEEYQNAKENSDRQNAKITHDKKVVAVFQKFIFDHTELYREFTENPEFRAELCNALFKINYDGPRGNLPPVPGNPQEAAGQAQLS